MEHFKSYLSANRIVPEKKLSYYLSWVTQFYAFCDKPMGNEVSNDKIKSFLKHLMKKREEWQVSQASEAIQLYLYFNRRGNREHTKKTRFPRPMESCSSGYVYKVLSI